MSTAKIDFNNALGFVKDRLKASYGDEFEASVVELLKILYGNDHIRVDAFGSHGDGGRDVWHEDSKTIYAVHAKKEQMNAKTTQETTILNKLNSDFNKAKEHEPRTFIFVYNQGNLPFVVKRCSELNQENPDIDIKSWSTDELIYHLKKQTLDRGQKGKIYDWIGAKAQEFSIDDLENFFYSLRETFSGQPAKPLDFTVPSLMGNKIEYNGLGDDIQKLLTDAFKNVSLIEEFLSNNREDYDCDDIDNYLRTTLSMIQENNNNPSDIFYQLREQVQSDSKLYNSPVSIPLINSFLCYFFDRCIIFDQPPEGWQT